MSKLKLWMTTNRPFQVISRTYIEFTTPYEKLTDVGIPLVLAIVFCFVTFWRCHSYAAFHSFASGLVSLVATVLAISAGFNVASMAVIGTSPGSFVKEFAKRKDSRGKSHLEGLLSMFAWAVLIQLILLILCLAYYAIDSLLVSSKTDIATIGHITLVKLDFAIPVVSIGLFLILHSIILSMRNVSGLFLLIIQTAKHED